MHLVPLSTSTVLEICACAGDGTTGSDDSGSVGGIGVSGGGEAGIPSHSNGGIEGERTAVVVGVVFGVVACGVADGGVARADSGERCSLFSSL
jgi:hypothetical protein